MIYFTVIQTINSKEPFDVKGPFTEWPSFNPKIIAILEESINGIKVISLPNCPKDLVDKIKNKFEIKK